MKLFFSATSILLCLSLVSCASIIHGTSQDVGFSSTPPGAFVTVDNHPECTTPCVAHLKRKDNHVVKMDLNGYQTFSATLTREASGWVWGNIVFGGLVGLVVDAVDGGFYNLTPKHVTATLVAKPTTTALTNSTGK